MAGGLKVVGPNVRGKREEYQLVRRLQSALFGGVYEAKGLSSGRDFAIKVLHKSELSKAQETSSIEFCEVPLSEIRFAELMRGDEHVMDTEDHFEDMYCFYVVFDLCRGGDLLEALKQKPHGFDEAHAQFLMQQAAKGLAYLHRRRVAMQDVSLENMLLHVDEASGYYQVKVCDPGQAVIFETDHNGEELPVGFRGLVGKSFRPPELHEQQPYFATKVDSWCLGWSTFYLLTAQPLFMSADPQQKDADWLLFQQGEYTTLFQQKSNLCSRTGLDFIFRLLQLEPSRRMSVTDALEHKWLADPKVMPVLAPKELLPESLRNRREAEGQRDAEAAPREAEHMQPLQVLQPSASYGGSSPGTGGVQGCGSVQRLHDGMARMPTLNNGSCLSPVANSCISWSGGGCGELPNWASANASAFGSNPHSPTLRVRSPMRVPRASGASSPRLAGDRRRQPLHHGASARAPYVIATAHSPPPGTTPQSPTLHRAGLRAGPRTASPCAGLAQHGHHLQQHGLGEAQPPRPAFLTPRSTSRTKLSNGTIVQSPHGVLNQKAESPEGDERLQNRAWAFKSDNAPADCSLKPEQVPYIPQHGRQVASPHRTQGGSTLYMARSQSPLHPVEATMSSMVMRPVMRTPSPVSGPPRPTAVGFSWTQAPATFSPRNGLSASANLARAPSPGTCAMSGPVGFAWSPDPPSPRTSPRAFSPVPAGAIHFAAKAMAVAGGVRSAPRRSGPI